MQKNKDNDKNMKNKKRDTGRTKEKFPVKTKQEETSKLNSDEGIGGAKIVYATEPTFSGHSRPCRGQGRIGGTSGLYGRTRM